MILRCDGTVPGLSPAASRSPMWQKVPEDPTSTFRLMRSGAVKTGTVHVVDNRAAEPLLQAFINCTQVIVIRQHEHPIPHVSFARDIAIIAATRRSRFHGSEVEPGSCKGALCSTRFITNFWAVEHRSPRTLGLVEVHHSEPFGWLPAWIRNLLSSAVPLGPWAEVPVALLAPGVFARIPHTPHRGIGEAVASLPCAPVLATARCPDAGWR